MKKLFALLLALMMVFALVACDQGDTPGGSNTDNPGTSQGGEENPGTQGGENTPGTQGGEENNGGETATPSAEWPTADFITPAMKWNGSGKVMTCDTATFTDLNDRSVIYNGFYVNVDVATLDEIGAYIEALKADGFTYESITGGTDEPALEYKSNFGVETYSWRGVTSDGRIVEIYLYKTPRELSVPDENMKPINYTSMLSLTLREGAKTE